MKLGTTGLTAILVYSVSTAVLAHEAPVVDAQQQQSAVSTQAETVTGGSWQPVTPSSSQPTDSWRPVSNSPSHDQSNNAYQAQSATPTQEAAIAPDHSGSIHKRVARLEQQMSNYNQMNLPQEITDLQQKNADLQGQLEVAQHNLKKVTDQEKLYYQDLEQQISQLQNQKGKKVQLSDNTPSRSASSEDAPSKDSLSKDAASKDTSSGFVEKDSADAASSDGKKDSIAKSDSSDQSAQSAQDKSVNLLSQKKAPSLSDADTYDKAFRSLSNKHFDAAQKEFHTYLQGYPKGRFAVNAHFWLGEIALMRQHYDVATKEFQTVVSRYPQSNKVSDAKLKIAMIHAAKGQVDVARTEFTQIRKEYPGTTAAQLASIRLQQLENATSVTQ
jgi:tol-pal system protein YbgF